MKRIGGVQVLFRGFLGGVLVFGVVWREPKAIFLGFCGLFLLFLVLKVLSLVFVVILKFFGVAIKIICFFMELRNQNAVVVPLAHRA